MILTNFILKYPEIAKKETRNLKILKEGHWVSKWTYEIQEIYCTDPKCDCRKVFFNIIWPNNEIYYLDYGFKKAKYYFKKGFCDKEMSEEMSWLSVNMFNWNPSESKKMFDIMKRVLEDKKYIKRLKKHYKMMKKEVAWFEDPFLFDDDNEILFFNEEDFFDFKEPKSLDNKTKKERQKKKNAKKQRRIQRKKSKKK